RRAGGREARGDFIGRRLRRRLGSQAGEARAPENSWDPRNRISGVNASRALNLALAVLILTLGGLLVAHRMRDAAPPPPPGFEELHAGAMTRVATGAPDSIEALERARATMHDPAAAELYSRAIE